MNNKKILITCLYPNEANPTIAIAIAKALREDGFDVYALIEESTVNFYEWIHCLGKGKVQTINIINPPLRCLKVTRYLNVAKFLLFSKEKSLNKLINIEFDYCLFTFFHRWNDLIFNKIKSHKKVLFLHDPIPHSGENKKLLKRQKHQAHKVDEIVVLSRKFIPIVEKEYCINISKIHYMPHGTMDYSKNPNGARTKFDDNILIHFLFFGRICEYKGIDILLKSFNLLISGGNNAELTIAGKGDLNKYNMLLNNNVTVINRYIDDSEIEDMFTQTNTVVILPYRDATQSGVIPIAAKYGTPVIASSTGGLIEQLDNGKIGLFVEPGNVDSLVDVMMKVINNRECLFMESNKMLKYHDKLDWVVIIRNLINELTNAEGK